MKRFLRGGAALALTVATVLGAGAHGVLGAGPGQHARTNAAYGAATLYAQNGGIAQGSMAAMPSSEGLKTILYVANLTPDQIYSARIVHGACGRTGATAFNLGDSQADTDGSIIPVATLPSMSIPARGLAVVVQQAKSGAPVVACGAIHPAGQVVHLNSVKTSIESAASGLALISHVMGNRDMMGGSMEMGTEVVVYAQGLAVSTVHEDHIHAGVCSPDKSGQVMHMLTDIETNQNGEGVASTFISGMPSFSNQYINVHGVNLQPAACGNL